MNNNNGNKIRDVLCFVLFGIDFCSFLIPCRAKMGSSVALCRLITEVQDTKIGEHVLKNPEIGHN